MAKTLEESGLEASHARRLSEVGLTLLIGAQQLGTGDHRRVTVVLDEYRRWVDAQVASLAPEGAAVTSR
ncbi:MAG: hypothetical protein ACR2MN_14525 [Acidimicrobiales bacterium]